MSFEQMIKSCFGEVDCIFAGHSIEKKHARLLLVEASSQGYDLTGIEVAARQYLEKRNCSIEHIEEQIERIRDVGNYL